MLTCKAFCVHTELYMSAVFLICDSLGQLKGIAMHARPNKASVCRFLRLESRQGMQVEVRAPDGDVSI